MPIEIGRTKENTAAAAKTTLRYLKRAFGRPDESVLAELEVPTKTRHQIVSKADLELNAMSNNQVSTYTNVKESGLPGTVSIPTTDEQPRANSITKGDSFTLRQEVIEGDARTWEANKEKDRGDSPEDEETDRGDSGPKELPKQPRMSAEGDDLWTGSHLRKASSVDLPAFAHVGRGAWAKLLHAARWVNKHAVFEPNSKLKSYWDWILLLLVIYVSVWVPLTVGMNVVDSGCSDADGTRCYASYFNILDWVVDVCFWIDIFASMRTGFHMRDGVPTTDPVLCAKNYLFSIWFPIDFVASFPFERLAEAITGEKAGRALRLQRLPKLLRLGRLRKKFDDLAQGYLLRIFFYLTVYMLLAHALACGMFALGTLGMSAFDDLCEAEAEVDAGGTARSWVAVANIGCDTTLFEQYTSSLYFILTTLSTVGYGDISPVTDRERWAVMLCFLIGLVGNGIMLGNIAAVIQTAEVHARVHREWMHNINVLIKSQGLPSELAFQLRNHAQFYNLISQGLDISNTLKGMPFHVQEGVLMHIHASVVKNVALWRVAKEDEGFCRAIVTRLKTENVLPQEWLMQEGDATFHMYFVLSGKTSAHTKKMGQLATIGVGGYFGELSTISGCRRVASVKAEEHCHLAALTREAFLEVIAAYPEYEGSVLEAAERKVVKWKLLDDEPHGGDGQMRVGEGSLVRRLSVVSACGSETASEQGGGTPAHPDAGPWPRLPGEVALEAASGRDRVMSSTRANSQIYNSIRQSFSCGSLGAMGASYGAGPALSRSTTMQGAALPGGGGGAQAAEEPHHHPRLGHRTASTRNSFLGKPSLERQDSAPAGSLLTRLSSLGGGRLSGAALSAVMGDAEPAERHDSYSSGGGGGGGNAGHLTRARSNSVSFADEALANLRRPSHASQHSIEEEEEGDERSRWAPENGPWTPMQPAAMAEGQAGGAAAGAGDKPPKYSSVLTRSHSSPSVADSLQGPASPSARLTALPEAGGATRPRGASAGAGGEAAAPDRAVRYSSLEALKRQAHVRATSSRGSPSGGAGPPHASPGLPTSGLGGPSELPPAAAPEPEPAPAAEPVVVAL